MNYKGGGKLFCFSILIGAAFAFTVAWVKSPNRHNLTVHKVDESGVYVTNQIRKTNFPQLRRLRIRTIVDMRPDGEAKDQPPSSEIEKESKRYRIEFVYIPTPHGDIPSSGIDKLADVLTDGRKPMLLYCRTGNRAVRTYCLAEAGRNGGRSAEELNATAKSAGFKIDDLQKEITRRIAARRSN